MKAVKLEEKQNWSGCVIEKDCLEYYDELAQKSKVRDAGVEYLEKRYGDLRE